MVSLSVVNSWDTEPPDRAANAWVRVPHEHYPELETLALMLGCWQDFEGWWVLPEDCRVSPHGSSYMLVPHANGVVSHMNVVHNRAKEWLREPSGPWDLNIVWYRSWCDADT